MSTDRPFIKYRASELEKLIDGADWDATSTIELLRELVLYRRHSQSNWSLLAKAAHAASKYRGSGQERAVPSEKDAIGSACPGESDDVDPPGSLPNPEGRTKQWYAAITTVLSWASSLRMAEDVATLVEQLQDTRGVPADVRDARELICRTDLRDISPVGLEVEGLASELLETLNERERFILAHRLAPKQSMTLQALGNHFGVEREWIRQLEGKALRKLRYAESKREPAELWWFVNEVDRRLGSLVPSKVAEHEVVDVVGRPVERWVVVLLLYLSGPYEESEGWYMRSGNTLNGIEQALVRATEDHPITVDDARAVLREYGCAEPHFEPILAAFDSVHLLESHLVKWGKNLEDKAVAVLQAFARPMTVEQIATYLDRDYHRRGMRNRLMEDSRIARVSKDEFALRDWGLDEYSSIAGAIQRCLEEAGGEAPLAEIAGKIASQFGVSENSVKSFCEVPAFLVEDGVVRFRKQDEKLGVRPSVTDVRGAYRYGERVSYLVSVDSELLRGSGRPIHPGLAALLGAQPGGSREFVGPSYSVKIYWSLFSMQPAIGSLRPIAAFLSAQKGSAIRLEFDRAEGLVCAFLVPADVEPEQDGHERLRNLTGLPEGPREVSSEVLARAVNTAGSSLKATLRERGDLDVLELLPPEHDASLDEAVESLSRAFEDAIEP